MVLNMVYAQRGLGKPKMPEDIAGIDTDSQSSFVAQSKVLLTQELNKPTSSLLPYRSHIKYKYNDSYITPNRSHCMYNVFTVLHLTRFGPSR